MTATVPGILRRDARPPIEMDAAPAPGTVAAYRLQGAFEWLRGRPRKARAWWRKSLAMAEKLGMRYEGALTELEMGRRLDDRALLEKAAATFADIGAQFDVAQARELTGNPHQELASGTAS